MEENHYLHKAFSHFKERGDEFQIKPNIAQCFPKREKPKVYAREKHQNI